MGFITFLLLLLIGPNLADFNIRYTLDPTLPSSGLTVTPDSYYVPYFQHSAIPIAMQYLSKVISLKYPGNQTLYYPAKDNGILFTECYDLRIPLDANNGVYGEYFHLFKFKISGSRTRATTLPCYQSTLPNGRKGRPLMGITWINPNNFPLPLANVVEHERAIHTLIHETLHSLAFYDDLFPTFINPNTGSSYESTNSLAQFITPVKQSPFPGDYEQVRYVIHPVMVQKTREFFACSKLEGYPLHYKSPHPHARTFWNSFMMQVLFAYQRMDPLTLWFLDSTGFYQTDKTFADLYLWGKGRGCNWFNLDYVRRNRNIFPENNPSVPDLVNLCDLTGDGGAQNQWLDSRNKILAPGGDSTLACTMDDTSGSFPDQVRGAAANYGVGKCFSGNLFQLNVATVSFNYFCFRHQCGRQGNKQTITIRTASNALLGTCVEGGPKKLTIQDFETYRGSLDCPDVPTFCLYEQDTQCHLKCFGNGDCVNGKCTNCKQDWHGRYCHTHKYGPYFKAISY